MNGMDVIRWIGWMGCGGWIYGWDGMDKWIGM
jgi:hypothetical protein